MTYTVTYTYEDGRTSWDDCCSASEAFGLFTSHLRRDPKGRAHRVTVARDGKTFMLFDVSGVEIDLDPPEGAFIDPFLLRG